MKLSKTGIGLLTRLYRSVLHKCFLINIGLFAAMLPSVANAALTSTGVLCYNSSTGAVTYIANADSCGSNTRLAAFRAMDEGNTMTSGSVSIGGDASGWVSTAVGDGAMALGWVSTAMGHAARATGYQSIALGYKAVAESSNSIAIGYMSYAGNGSALSVGHKKTDIDPATSEAYGSNLFRKIVNVANGSDANDAATVGQMNTALAGKQATLSTAQLNAANSGITSAKVSTYDGYAATIATKADSADLNNYYTKYGVEGQKVANDNGDLNNLANAFEAKASNAPTAKPSWGTKAHKFAFVLDDSPKGTRQTVANDNLNIMEAYNEVI